MANSCCAVQYKNYWGKCDENFKFYRISTMKNQQTIKRRKNWITTMKRENWPKSEKQINNARLCSIHFVTGAKSDDLLHIDHSPTVFAFVPVAGDSRKRKVLIGMKDLKNVLETRMRNKGFSQEKWNNTLCKCRGWASSIRLYRTNRIRNCSR